MERIKIAAAEADSSASNGAWFARHRGLLSAAVAAMVLLQAAPLTVAAQDTKNQSTIYVHASYMDLFDATGGPASLSYSPPQNPFGSLPPIAKGLAFSPKRPFSPQSAAPSTDCKKNPNGGGDKKADPVLLSSGSKIETFPLFQTPGEMGLKFVLYHNSGNVAPWTSNLDYMLDTTCHYQSLAEGATVTNCSQVTLHRPDGSMVAFSGGANNTSYPIMGNGVQVLTRDPSSGNYTLRDDDGSTQVYASSGAIQLIVDASGIGWVFTYSGGLLASVTHTNGQSIRFTYVPSANGGAPTVTVIDPAGNAYNYTGTESPANYTLNDVVSSISFPGSPATTLSFKGTSGGIFGEMDYNGTPYAYTTYDTTVLSVNNGTPNFGPYWGWATSTYYADGSGKNTIAYSTDSAGHLVATVTNPLGHVTTNTYAGVNGLLSTISDGATTTCGPTAHTRTYDSNGNLSQTVDNNGNVHTYNYAANGQLQTETEAAGTSLARKTDYVWDPTATLNRPLSVTVEGVRKTTYTYNAQNRIASVSVTNLSANGSAGQTLTTSYQYALYGNGLVQTMTVTKPSPNGSDTDTYRYDGLGNVTSISNGLGQTTSYGNYNGLGEPGAVTGPNGDTVNYTYDARGRVWTKTTHPNGGSATWTYGYDGFGLLSSLSGPDGQVTTWNRDQVMQVKSITHNDKDGTSTESFQYDANGDVTQHTIARGTTTTLIQNVIYDGLGRVYQRLGQHGQSLTYVYDGNGNVASVTNAAGHVTSHQYDALDRATRTVESGGASPSVGSTAQASATISYMHDAGNQLTSVTDPRGLITGYVYDGLGQLWQQTSPDTGTTSYNYDGNGRRTSMTRANGVLTTYAYDAIGRTTGISAGGQSQTFTYDSCANGLGRLCSAANAGGHVGYGYTPEGWVSNRSFTVGGASYSLGYGYNATGDVAAVIYPDGNQAIYNYTNGVVSSISLNIGGVGKTAASQITYQPQDSNMASWVGSNGLTTHLYYDTDGRFTGANVPAVLTYGIYYDNANRIAKKQDFISPVLTENFGYDEQSRLVSETGGAENESYQYDANGNRIAQTVNGTSMNLFYEGGSNRMINAGGVTFGYDAVGNTTTANGKSGWQFDPFNRMTSDSGNTYYIDPQGQRLMKSVSGTTTYFAPDESNHLIAENDAGVWVDYLWLNGRLIGRIHAGQVQDIHVDQLGRPEAMTDASQALAWRAMNFPFSRSVATNNAVPLNIGFPGQYFDAELNLWNNGYRDYFYWVGRYLESDPIGLGGGINTYAYVDGGPINLIDPSGLGGFGLNAGGSAQAGVVHGGAMQANSGAGLFWGNGLNAGWYTASGSFAGRGNFDYHMPGNQDMSGYTPDNGYSTMAIGASAGLGAGIWGTNANSAEQLLGPFDTSTLNFAFLSFQWAEADGTWVWSVGFSKGLGFDFNRYQVVTTAAGTFYRRKSICH
ncbi:RHS repeat-associated core domain-containing protein [Dyella acidisoli]|uniref:RHS repeat-associated core domain-containing protein n=1 Tax=Dyella acidisoli TaxID=1867834 RepID=UPI0024E0CE45|nr:RHS repeat-associated core domain-containing protein [Dyella acidisoli]